MDFFVRILVGFSVTCSQVHTVIQIVGNINLDPKIGLSLQVGMVGIYVSFDLLLSSACLNSIL